MPAALRLAEIIPQARLHPEVLAWTAKRPARETWAVALSGGADSLALLLLLWAHWPERRARLLALHFNHKLRGRAADADEKFCHSVCARLGVRFRAGRWRAARRGASEAEARAARMDFFEREQRAARSKVLWLGHQMDDVAETLLMRLARGSGTSGLAAPRPTQLMPKGRTHLRPLLTLKKEEIVAALRQAGAHWREDATNAGADFFRNRIRHAVLPDWIKSAPERDVLAGAALSREFLAEDDAALEAWLSELTPISSDGALDLRRLAGKPRALVRRALHRWLLGRPGGRELSRQGFVLLMEAAIRGQPTRQSLGAQGFAVIRRGRLVYAKRK